MCRKVVRCYVFILTLLDISLNTKLTALGNNHGVTVQETLIEGVTFQEWESSEGRSAGSHVLGLVATPPALALGCVPLSEPRAATVTLTNTGNATLHLASLAGTTHHFHASFFTAKAVPPQGNASFSVVYLGLREGLVAAHLYIHTSLGVHKYPVSAVGVASSWGVWPLVGVRVPENATVRSTLSLHNPTDHLVQVSEVYSSASWVTLELPEGGASAPRALWAIPPHSDRALVRLRLDPPTHHHPLTAYIRIKGNMTGGGAVVVGVEASRVPAGPHLRPLQLRLGTRGHGDPPYTVQIEAANSAEGEGEGEVGVGVWGVRCSSQPRDPADDPPPPAHAHKHAANGGGWSHGVSVSPVSPRTAPRRALAPAATLTLNYERLWAERERDAGAEGAGSAGDTEAWCGGWAVVGGAALPYSVRLVSGTVRSLPTDMHWVLEQAARSEVRELRVRNEFATDVRVCAAHYPHELDAHFQIETMTPLMVPAGGEATVARVRLRGEAGGAVRAAVTLRTNITGYSVRVPVYLYSGKLTIEWEWPGWSGGALWLGALRPWQRVSVRARLRHAGPARACGVRLATSFPHARFELAACRHVPHAHDDHPCRCVGAGEEVRAVLVVRAGAAGGARGVAVARWGGVTSLSHVALLTLPGTVRAQLAPHAQHAAAPYSWWSADVVVHNGLPRALRVVGLAHDHHKALNFTAAGAGRVGAGRAEAAGALRFAPELLCLPHCYTGLDLRANEGVAWIRRGRVSDERALRGDVALVRQRLAQFGRASREPLVAELRTSLGRVTVRATLAAGWPRLCAGPVNAPPVTPGAVAPLLVTVRNPSRSHHLLLQPALGPPLSLPLLYFVTGETYQDLHFSYRLGASTIGEIVKEVCKNIWTLIHEECLSIPNTQEGWLQIADGFENKANFPNCIGCIDGKHVRIICPEYSGSLYSNYKKNYSVVLLAMCDSDYRYTYINVGAYGTDSDSNIFRRSSLFTKLQNGEITLPPPKPLPHTTEPIPYMIIGDAAFGISNKILRPYARSNLTHKKKIFNYRLSRARRYIESTFGIMSNKFKIFHRPMNTSLPNTIAIIKACCVLHNYIRERDGYRIQDTLTVEGFDDLTLDKNINIRSGDAIRDKFANYFVSPVGSVTWQDAYIF